MRSWKKYALRSGAIALCISSSALAATFTWTGNGTPDDHWDVCENWQQAPGGCRYPSTTSDDVRIPGADLIRLIDEEVDDITITGSVTFHDLNADDPVLQCDSLTIEADTSEVVVEIIFGAGILAD